MPFVVGFCFLRDLEQIVAPAPATCQQLAAILLVAELSFPNQSRQSKKFYQQQAAHCIRLQTLVLKLPKTLILFSESLPYSVKPQTAMPLTGVHDLVVFQCSPVFGHGNAFLKHTAN
jgi:hypothetical protein